MVIYLKLTFVTVPCLREWTSGGCVARYFDINEYPYTRCLISCHGRPLWLVQHCPTMINTTKLMLLYSICVYTVHELQWKIGVHTAYDLITVKISQFDLWLELNKAVYYFCESLSEHQISKSLESSATETLKTISRDVSPTFDKPTDQIHTPLRCVEPGLSSGHVTQNL